MEPNSKEFNFFPNLVPNGTDIKIWKKNLEKKEAWHWHILEKTSNGTKFNTIHLSKSDLTLIFYKNLRMNQIQKNSLLQILFIIAKLENEEAYWHTLKSFNSNESSKLFQIWFSINIFYKKFRMELSNRIESKIRKLKKETLIYFKKSLDSNRTKFSKFNSHYYLGKNFRIEYQKIRRSLTFIYFIKIYISIKLIKFKKTHSQ